MISSGLNEPSPAMPIPALAVPNAAPIAEVYDSVSVSSLERRAIMVQERRTAENHLDAGMGDSVRHVACGGSLTAEATPAKPKKGANGGQVDMVEGL